MTKYEWLNRNKIKKTIKFNQKIHKINKKQKAKLLYTNLINL